MTRRRSSSKNKRRKSKLRRLFFFFLLFLTLGSAAVLRLTSSVTGRAMLVRYGISDFFLPQLTQNLDQVLADCFLDMGLLQDDVDDRLVVEGEVEVRRFRFETPAHLTPTRCNAYLNKVVLEAGAEVLQGRENHKRHGEIQLRFGFGDQHTHLVVIAPAAPPAAASKKSPKGAEAPRIVLVVDDFGQTLDLVARAMFDLGVNLTVAVLPDLPKSQEAFDLAAAHGMPALLHLPMEPERDLNAGKNPIRVGMTAAEIDLIVNSHIQRYGPVFIGVNNHMGSRATSHLPTMQFMMPALQKRGLFFLDSLTSPQSVATTAARAAGVWSLRNDLFLDDRTKSAKEVARNLRELARIASQAPSRTAIGIAHARDYTLRAFEAMLPRLVAEGYEFITLAELQNVNKSRHARRSGARKTR